MALRPPDPTDDERTALDRLAWLARLHWIAGTFILIRALLVARLLPFPGIIAVAMGIALGVFAVNGLVIAATRHWQRTRFMPLERLMRIAFNLQAAADLTALITSVHASGGADSQALPLSIVPLMTFGSLLPKRDAYFQAAFASVGLAIALGGEQTGWIRHACAGPPGCALPITAIAVGRYVTIFTLAWLTSYLSSYIGHGLRLQEAAARRLAKDRGELADLRANFATMVSHELRTPLSTIQASTSLLVRYADQLTAAQREQRGVKIEAQIRHMTRLVEDVLVLGGAEAGGLVCEPEPIDIETLCRDVVSEIGATTARAHQLLVDAQCLCKRPAVDPHLLRHIVDNLVTNAAKYSPAGSTVTITLRSDDGGVRLRVRDQGIGIAPADHPRLFEPFRRGGNVGSVPGTGLGLAITRKAVELHGGTITAESNVGTGTEFIVTLPGTTTTG